MGFIDYARSLSLQKDERKLRIRVDSKLQQPTLTRDKTGFNVTLPVPSVSKEKIIFFLGYEFLADPAGKEKAGRLFRACVYHLTAHSLMQTNDENTVSSTSKRLAVETFSESLVNDVYVNTCISAEYPNKLADMAYANSLAFARMKPVERIFNPATRIMIATLSKLNIGIVKGVLRPKEKKVVAKLTGKLSLLNEKIMASLAGDEIKLDEVFGKTVNYVTRVLESNGPILEAPSLQYTEQTGPCTVFSQCKMPSEVEIERIFRKSLKTLGGMVPSEESIESCWRKELNAETSQAFNSWFHKKDREKRLLAKLEKYTKLTKFKSVGFPEEDYTQYLRAKVLLRGGSRRLLDSLRVAQDALDEDPGQEYGQLDLPEVIQMLASGKARTDVFTQDEYLSRSYSWGLLLDASASMKVKGEQGRALAICVAEATKGLLMDPGSWTLFAFSDRFYVLKDASEAYSRRVRARIGGLKFDGLTYMPDALQVAGDIIGRRFESQKFLVILSDGWPYGYPNMSKVLSKTIDSLKKKGIMVIGVGLESERMQKFFKNSAAVYNQKDLVKKFAEIYTKTSVAALTR